MSKGRECVQLCPWVTVGWGCSQEDWSHTVLWAEKGGPRKHPGQPVPGLGALAPSVPLVLSLFGLPAWSNEDFLLTLGPQLGWGYFLTSDS